MRINPLLVATLLVVVAACTGASSPTPSAATLDGRTFLSTTVQGHDLVAGSTVSLAFKEGRLAINAGCNHIGGAYAIVGGRLTTGEMAMTDMGCAAPLMAQDTWLSGFVAGAIVDLAGDTLTLRNGGVTMTLTDREVADRDRPLEGTHWILDGITSGDTASSVPEGVTAALTITDGQMQIQTGCNRGNATVEATATTLTIGPMALTRMACPPDATAVELAVTRVLTGKVGYAIEADVLTLTSGTQGLTLRAGS